MLVFVQGVFGAPSILCHVRASAVGTLGLDFAVSFSRAVLEFVVLCAFKALRGERARHGGVPIGLAVKALFDFRASVVFY